MLRQERVNKTNDGKKDEIKDRIKSKDVWTPFKLQDLPIIGRFVEQDIDSFLSEQEETSK